MAPRERAETAPDDGGTVAAFERSARRWMRAYPRRWRETRGEELLTLLLDLAPPGAHRLDARTAIDLVRGGWATRWRGRPPFWAWVLYRTVGWRLPAPHRGWARDDILGAMFWARESAAAYLLILVVSSLQLAQPGAELPGWGYAAFFCAVWVTGAVIGTGRRREQALIKHVALRAGDPPHPGAWIMRDVPRRRLRARSVMPWWTGVVAASAAALAIPAAVAPKALNAIPRGAGAFEVVVGPIGDGRATVLAALAAALVAGVAGASVARRRLTRLMAQRAPQPDRRLVDLAPRGRVRLLVLFGWVAALVWLEVSGRLVLLVSVPLAVVALALLPGTLVVAHGVRRQDEGELAGRDLWTMAVLGRLPRTDSPAQRVVRGRRGLTEPAPALPLHARPPHLG